MDIDSKYRTFKWVLRVIESCTTAPQMSTSLILIENFNNRFNDIIMYKDLKSSFHDKLANFTASV